MGQAKLRGTFEERKAQAIAVGRSQKLEGKCKAQGVLVRAGRLKIT